jgi:hypothetical protein
MMRAVHRALEALVTSICTPTPALARSNTPAHARSRSLAHTGEVTSLRRKVLFSFAVFGMWVLERSLPTLKGHWSLLLLTPFFYIDDILVNIVAFKTAVVLGLEFTPPTTEAGQPSAVVKVPPYSPVVVGAPAAD